jgi:hypothetical protein
LFLVLMFLFRLAVSHFFFNWQVFSMQLEGL